MKRLLFTLLGLMTIGCSTPQMHLMWLGIGLGAAAVPTAGYITGFGAELVEAAYGRDDEREADILGVDYRIGHCFFVMILFSLRAVSIPC